MKTRHFVATALLAAACSSSQASITYGSNLIVNGDAESGTAGWNGYDSWSMFQSVAYGSNWVLPSQPGPVDRGSMMFAGLGSNAVGYQTLALGEATTRLIAYELSGWLGGWTSQGDNALLYVQFLDVSGSEISSAAIGPVTPDDRGNQTGLFYRESEGWLPIGTSTLSFWLSMERTNPSDNDGYADNLAFVLAAPTSVPEPESGVLVLLGIGLMALARRRR